MALPKISYVPVSTTITLQFVRGPVDFQCNWSPRVHDNLSTSGAARERVVEAMDILIAFTMPNLIIDDDMPAWASFLAFALAGGTFRFYPNAGLADFYNCVDEAAQSDAKWNAPKKYGATFKFRILNDSQAPPDPFVVLRRFYGVTS